MSAATCPDCGYVDGFYYVVCPRHREEAWHAEHDVPRSDCRLCADEACAAMSPDAPLTDEDRRALEQHHTFNLDEESR